MAKKATLVTITPTNNNVGVLNSNLNALNDALENTVSLDGSTPNAFTADLDLNGNDLLNATSLSTGLLYINGTLVNSIGNLANWKGDWTTSTAYVAYDLVYEASNNSVYRCLVAHTSGVFATDLAANNWELYLENIQRHNDLLDDIAALTATEGDILYVDGSGNLVDLGIGTAGQILAVNPGATAPEWVAATGGFKSAEEYIVDGVGSLDGTYVTIGDAITQINTDGPFSFDNPARIVVLETSLSLSAGVTLPTGVHMVSRGRTVVENTNASGSLFTLSGFNRIAGFDFHGGNASNTDAVFDCGNNTDISILDCNLYGNDADNFMKFLSASGATWARINVEHCLINYRGISGFAFNYNNSGVTRYVDCWLNDIFTDAFGNFTSTGGNIQLEGTGGVQDFRIRRSTIRGDDTDYIGLYLNSGGGECLVAGNNFDADGTVAQDGFDVSIASGEVLIDAGGNTAKRTNFGDGAIRGNSSVLGTGRRRIANYSGTGAANVDIDLPYINAKKYVISGYINPANDGVNLAVQTTTDGFSTVNTTAGDYSYIDYRNDDTGATATTQSNTGTSMRFATNVGNAANEFWQGDLTIHQPHSTTYSTTLRSDGVRINSAGAFNAGIAHGYRKTAEDNNGVRVLASAGNIDYDLTVVVEF